MNCVRKKVSQPFRPLLTFSIIKIQPKSQYSVWSFCQTKSQLVPESWKNEWLLPEVFNIHLLLKLCPPNNCIQNCPPPVMSWFTLLSILFPQAFLLDINFSTLLFTSLFSFVVVFLQLDRSIYFTFYLCLSHSTVSLRFSISSGSSSISLLQQHFYPSITHLSKSTATDACRHAKEKTHFLSYCHVSEI